MGNSSSHLNNGKPQSSKKHGHLSGNDLPTALDEEDRRPTYAQGRSACRAMERQGRHSRMGQRRNERLV